MITGKDTHAGTKFLDMQAAVGITKHIGGLEATDELLALCHIGEARTVLNVGCGIGVGPVYIAKQHRCQVVGVDISEQMIAWSQRRAREEGSTANTVFCVADALALPFAPNRFDAVICESVLVFVEDKPTAISEFVRVTKPGGHVGLNEGFWFEQPSPEMIVRVKSAVGPAIPTLDEWKTLWETSGLQERDVRTRQIEARAEVKSRVQWIGWRWLVRAWGRALRLYLTNPAIRQSIKEQFDVPSEVFQSVGYALFVGKKA